MYILKYKRKTYLRLKFLISSKEEVGFKVSYILKSAKSVL